MKIFRKYVLRNYTSALIFYHPQFKSVYKAPTESSKQLKKYTTATIASDIINYWTDLMRNSSHSNNQIGIYKMQYKNLDDRDTLLSYSSLFQ